MKIITAMVQPFMLSKVTSALEEIDDFPGMKATDVRGFAHTGNPGDGKVFVWPVEQAVRIQTGDLNDAAL